MQYCSAQILLYRPGACFGLAAADEHPFNKNYRENCVQHAIQIASYLRDYKRYHGSAATMLGAAFYSITTAATILIADIAERRSMDTMWEYCCLQSCVQALGELESTYVTARRVRNAIKLVIRVFNLDHAQGPERIGECYLTRDNDQQQQGSHSKPEQVEYATDLATDRSAFLESDFSAAATWSLDYNYSLDAWLGDM